MEINNSFTVEAPIDRAWTLLTDIPFIAPCLPGAQLTGEEDGVYSGGVKIKVGPVTAEYKGSAEFVEKDETTYKAVINGKGRDTRGAGNAQALITAQMVPVGSVTQIDIITDLKVSGKVAQFGRGVMQDVSTKLLGQFAECLEAKIAESETPVAHAAAPIAGAAAAAATTTTIIEPEGATVEGAPPPPIIPGANGQAPISDAATSASSTTDAGTSTSESSYASGQDNVLDLGDVGLGKSLAKRAAPAIGGVAAATVLVWLLRRIFGSSSRG